MLNVSLPDLIRQSIFLKGLAKRMDTRVKAAYDDLPFVRLPLFFVLSKTLGYMLLPTNFLIASGFSAPF